MYENGSQPGQGVTQRNPARYGHDFEERVRIALIRECFISIDKNQWRKNYSLGTDLATKREYDLVMLNTADGAVYIIECKSHPSGKKVGRSQVKEFQEKLLNYNGQNMKWLMVTDTDYSRQAREYAGQKGILLMNGQELSLLERRQRPAMGRAIRFAGSFLLEAIVKKAEKEMRR